MARPIQGDRLSDGVPAATLVDPPQIGLHHLSTSIRRSARMPCEPWACKAWKASVYGGGGAYRPARNETEYTLCLTVISAQKADGLS